MTISKVLNYVTANGNGSNKSWDFEFLIPTKAEMEVIITDTAEVETVADPSTYSVTGLDDEDGGTVTYPLVGDAIASGYKLTIRRVMSLTQLTKIRNQRRYDPQVVEEALDKLTLLLQNLKGDVDLAIKLPVSGGVTAENYISTLATYKQEAEAAKDAAEAAYDSLDDRYLGAKSSDPSTDNDGNALVVGAIYYNTGTGNWRYYNGSVWNDMTTPANPWETGDTRQTFKSSATTGWIFVQGQSLGDTGSGATLTGSAYEDLYAYFWGNIADAYAPVSTGRGASAAADWAAGKTLTMPDARDRAIFGVGSTWALGQTQGAETISKAQLPTDTLNVTGTAASDGAHTHNLTDIKPASNGNSIDPGGTGGFTLWRVSPAFTAAVTDSGGAHTHSVTGVTEAMGSGDAFLPKGLGMNLEIKL